MGDISFYHEHLKKQIEGTYVLDGNHSPFRIRR